MADAIVELAQQRMPDFGPRYVETPADPNNFPGWVAEPWNTASACLFVLIALVWIWVLRGRYRQHPFLTTCIPILATGGVGGVLFHGTRQYRAFFLMDVMPIWILGLCVTIWLWVRLGPRLWHLVGVIALLAFLQMLAQLQVPMQWAINISYASLALIVLIPVVLCLIRTRFRYAGWVYTSLACFAIAWLCRIADSKNPPLPMGTHWLWHVFGALTTAALSMYVYRVEGIDLRRPQTQSSEP